MWHAWGKRRKGHSPFTIHTAQRTHFYFNQHPHNNCREGNPSYHRPWSGGGQQKISYYGSTFNRALSTHKIWIPPISSRLLKIIFLHSLGKERAAGLLPFSVYAGNFVESSKKGVFGEQGEDNEPINSRKVCLRFIQQEFLFNFFAFLPCFLVGGRIRRRRRW